MRREVDLGQLSSGESAFASEARSRPSLDSMLAQHERMARQNARKHYTQMLATARAAAQQLNDYLDRGLPAARIPVAGGGFDASTGPAHADVRRLINAFVWANVALRGAAQLVVDVEDLPDDGSAHGIIFEMLL